MATASRSWRAQQRLRSSAIAGNFPRTGEMARSEILLELAQGLIGGSMDSESSPHIPVMLLEVVEALQVTSGQVVIDATFGAGGYSRVLLERGCSVIGIDRDPDAVAAGQPMVAEFESSLMLEQGRFSNLDAIAHALGHLTVDAIVADIGVSSMQIDQADRGFSFQKDGPLDMRMEQTGISAADVVNGVERSDLTRIIGILGDERRASHISSRIVEERQKRRFETTLQLASCVEAVLGRKRGDKIHPATRTFQALRIFVNAELDQLAEALLAAERVLKPGGRLAIVTFHSLEDRLVKKFLLNRSETQGGSRHLPQVTQKTATFDLEKRNASSASSKEADVNPRARSAKLRYAIRTDAPPRSNDASVFGLPNLASLSSVERGSQ